MIERRPGVKLGGAILGGFELCTILPSAPARDEQQSWAKKAPFAKVCRSRAWGGRDEYGAWVVRYVVPSSAVPRYCPVFYGVVIAVQKYMHNIHDPMSYAIRA
jgi:hypothetical protein